MKNLILVLITTLLASCAALEQNHKNTCASYDWEAMGTKDALAGESARSSVLSQCMKVGVPQTRNAYDQGYAKGLMQFCTYEYGIYWGREGREYENTCTPSIANKFLAGYSKGKMEYEQLQVAKAQARPQVILVSQQAKACTFNSDCNIQIKCNIASRKCDGTGKDCMFDNDCTIPGHCSDDVCTNR